MSYHQHFGDVKIYSKDEQRIPLNSLVVLVEASFRFHVRWVFTYSS